MLRSLIALLNHSISLLRVISVLIVALFLPQMFMWHSQHIQQPLKNTPNACFKLGIENISEDFVHTILLKDKKKCRVGLITNQTGTDQAGNRNIEILAHKGFSIKKIFLPSYLTEKNDTSAKESFIHGKNMIPVIALNMEAGASVFNKENIHDVDALIFDMQDVGVRHYGYVSTLLHAMQAARKNKKKFIVLDRPNLLGWCMEGSCDSDNKSAVPSRHGMTIGEIATYFNKYILPTSIDLHVIAMSHYNRQSEARKPLLCSLSPNIATIDSCYGYSFLGLLGEVHPFEIGIGTDKAFQCILLPEKLKFPKQKWHDLRSMLKEQGIESKLYRCFSQRKNEYCSGLRLYIPDINRFSSFNALISVLRFFKDSGLALTFSEKFDKALGTKKIQSFFNGTISHTEFADEVNGKLQSFFKKAVHCFLYKPFPKMMQV